MLCPSCGKEVKRGFCKDCFLELYPVRLKDFSLKICKCGKYFYRGKWKSSLEESLSKVIRDNLILPKEINLEKVEILSKEIGKSSCFVEIEIKGTYENKDINQKISPEIRIKKEPCDRCKKRPEYYEATIQFRGFKPKFEIDHTLVSDVKKIHDGWDFYITRRRYAKKIAHEFKKKGFRVKESETLFGITKEGKRRSRLTISIKPTEE